MCRTSRDSYRAGVIHSPWYHAHWIIGALLVSGLVLTMPQLADCGVDVFGAVAPMDNPWTFLENEGIPTAGNFIDDTRSADDQPTLEGVFSYGDDWADPSDDTNSIPQIIVGKNAHGLVQVLSPTQLNFGDLIIGRSEANASGNGVVEISGLGATYNSDFEIVDQQLATFGTSGTIRSGLSGADSGFDLIVGETGTGTLLISSGGRAEIHDSIVAGDKVGSYGQITIDGFSSYLSGGTFAGTAPSDADPQMTVIGRQGTGVLNITNGANVLSATSFNLINSDKLLGAVVGGNPFFLNESNSNDESPERGGSGTVVIDGSGSRWAVDGGLQLGGFADLSEINDDANAAITGINARYGADVGDATVTVRNQGRLSVQNLNSSGSITSNQLKTQLLIGRSGRLNLETGGRVDVGLAAVTGGDSGDNDENVILINDGIISGSGRIDVGLFRNRHLGEVRVESEDVLLINSTSNLGDADAGPQNVPLVNYGLIQVHDGELEVTRGEDDIAGSAEATYQAFSNLRLNNSQTTQMPSRGYGQIESHDGTLRFQTGVVNQGLVNFVGGTNRFYGNIVNQAGTPEIEEGLIAIVGDDTFVVFNDPLTNAGSVYVGPNALGYTASEFTNSGTLSLVLGGGDSGNEFSTVLSMGDIMLQGGTLEITLNQSGANPIAPQAGDEYVIMRAEGELSGDFADWNLPFLGIGSGLVPIADLDSDIYKLVVQSSICVVGGDLNCDGIVDFNDIIIWQANAGNPGGLGDINGDNLVNGLDLQIIQVQFGGPGIALGSTSTVVPEPATAVFVWLALATLFCSFRRGR